MKKYLEILKKCPLFKGVDSNNLLAMLDCLDVKTEFFYKKQTILSEGSPAESICVMLKGSGHICRIDYFGNRSILSDIHEGEMFAEAFACASTEKLPISVIADEYCEVMMINSENIMNTCDNGCDFHRRLVFNLMQELAARTIMFQQKIEITSQKTTREKLMTYLMICAKKSGCNSFEIPFDRQALADYLGVDRSGLSAEIGKLRKDGIIECRKNKFTVTSFYMQ